MRDTPFSWKGRANCIHLARAQLVAMGHKPGPVPHFTSAVGAKKALHKRGFDTLEALIDGVRGIVRIPPASAWIGDLVLLPGEALFDAVTVAQGGGFVSGWHGDGGDMLTSIRLDGAEPLAAWRL